MSPTQALPQHDCPAREAAALLATFDPPERSRGAELLQLGLGCGEEHLALALAGARCHGVDPGSEPLAITAALLERGGVASELRRAALEALPFPPERFDRVLSAGALGAAQAPPAAVAEVHRVLRPGGVFLGVFLGRRSPQLLRLWLRRALLRGRPWRRLREVIGDLGPGPRRAHTAQELRRLFAPFQLVELEERWSREDLRRVPERLLRLLPPGHGGLIVVRAIK